MNGRWTLLLNSSGQIVGDAADYDQDLGDTTLPVVPCDGAAVQRGANAVNALHERVDDPTPDDIAAAVLQAAGEAGPDDAFGCICDACELRLENKALRVALDTACLTPIKREDGSFYLVHKGTARPFRGGPR